MHTVSQKQATIILPVTSPTDSIVNLQKKSSLTIYTAPETSISEN